MATKLERLCNRPFERTAAHADACCGRATSLYGNVYEYSGRAYVRLINQALARIHQRRSFSVEEDSDTPKRGSLRLLPFRNSSFAPLCYIRQQKQI